MSKFLVDIVIICYSYVRLQLFNYLASVVLQNSNFSHIFVSALNRKIKNLKIRVRNPSKEPKCNLPNCAHSNTR